MDLAAYEAEAVVEESHWWFTGRRILFAREIAKLNLASDASILDVGTSTGTNLRMLRDEGFARVTGLDFSATAISFCQSKGFTGVQRGDVCAMPFEDNNFDLVLATDIIEHVDNDRQAAREIQRVLKPGGKAIVTVPAFQSLWGLQDYVAQHKRRYRQRGFLDTLGQGDLRVLNSFYFNFILFLPIFAARQVIKIFKVDLKTENDVNNPFLNTILSGLFRLDINLAPKLKVPFGVSLFALVEKPMDDRESD